MIPVPVSVVRGYSAVNLLIHFVTFSLGVLCFAVSAFIIWALSCYGECVVLLCIYPWLASIGSIWFTGRQLQHIRDIRYTRQLFEQYRQYRRT